MIATVTFIPLTLQSMIGVLLLRMHDFRRVAARRFHLGVGIVLIFAAGFHVILNG